MRFMVIIRADAHTEAGEMPSMEAITAMGRFNEEMVKAGVLLAAEGLQPSAQGARVHFDGSKRTVVDGPFTETKELIAGFWLIQVKSKEEAIEWVKRFPNLTPDETVLEIRRVAEWEDLGENLTPELREQEARIDALVAAKAQH